MESCPLWLRQPREHLQIFLYKKIYIFEIKKARKQLKDVIVFVEKLPSSEEDSSYKIYEDHLIKVPSYMTLQNASKKWSWIRADEDYSNYLVELDNKRREENYNRSVDEMDNLLDTMFEITKDSAEELKHSDYKSSTKIQLGYTLSRTIDLLHKNKRLNHGRPITISEAKQDVTVDADVEYFGLKELANAFKEGRDEYIKQKGEE